MQELLQKIAMAESARPAGLVAYCYVPDEPVNEMAIILEVETMCRFERKDLLCDIRLYGADGKPLVAEGNWPVSEGLKAPYHYLPAIDGSEQVRLDVFRSSVPFAAAALHVRLWNRKDAASSIRIRTCLVQDRLVVGSGEFVHYRRLEQLELQS